VCPTPDDHVIVAQDSCVTASAIRRVSYTCRRPTVRGGIVFSARVEHATFAYSAPNDHFAACPDRGVRSPCGRRIGSVCGNPAIRSGSISCACVEEEDGIFLTAPDNHFAT